MYKAINKELIDQHNQSQKSNLDFDFEYLEQKLKKSNIDIHAIKEQIKKFQVAVPTWGVGTGGTRFARFPGIGEPQNIFDKIEDSTNNHTRFVTLSSITNKIKSKSDKTSILVNLTDGHGVLAEFLQEFHDAKINLTKLVKWTLIDQHLSRK